LAECESGGGARVDEPYLLPVDPRGPTGKLAASRDFGFKPGKVACHATGKTKFAHRECFQGRGAFSSTTPLWVDPDPCPALASRHERQMKRQREKSFEINSTEKIKKAVPTCCARLGQNKRKVQKIVKLLGVDRSLKPALPVPKHIPCGSLRQSVTAMFSLDQNLSLSDKLSIKTAAKAESQPCPYCEDLMVGEKVDKWKKERLASEVWSPDHLDRFAHAFSANVEPGWNRRASWFPYVPNGGATELFSRRDGGNWNSEAFSDSCRVDAVFTNGRYRIVTMYSGYNVSVLTPLHKSLYESVRKKGWLLVGSPTNERLRHLSEGCKGQDWLSFDYEQATDKIKTAYVRRAVEILISKAEGLTEDEVRCMRVVSSLSLDGACAGSGQPMGSPLSFPLLCLINKTVVDLALTELLREGKISFKEWTSHRCLINGDDLLTKDTSSSGLAEAIFANGKEVGLKSNWDKTLRSPVYGEINSTVFENCVRQTKTNVSALWMSADVSNVLDFARESCLSDRGVVMIAQENVSRLARQKIKTEGFLSHKLKERLLSVPKIKRALCQRPLSDAPKDTNLIPVVSVPDGYDLSREEEVASLLDRVTAIREGNLFRNLAAEKKRNARRRKNIKVSECEKFARKGLYKLLKKNKPREEPTVLACFASTWEKKRKEQLALADKDVFSFTFTKHCRSNPFTADLDLLRGKSSIVGLQQMIKTFKDKRKVVRPIPLPDVVNPVSASWNLQSHSEEILRTSCCFASRSVAGPNKVWQEYVSLTDGD